MWRRLIYAQTSIINRSHCKLSLIAINQLMSASGIHPNDLWHAMSIKGVVESPCSLKGKEQHHLRVAFSFNM
jgi:hypothetical protein